MPILSLDGNPDANPRSPEQTRRASDPRRQNLARENQLAQVFSRESKGMKANDILEVNSLARVNPKPSIPSAAVQSRIEQVRKAPEEGSAKGVSQTLQQQRAEASNRGMSAETPPQSRSAAEARSTEQRRLKELVGSAASRQSAKSQDERAPRGTEGRPSGVQASRPSQNRGGGGLDVLA